MTVRERKARGIAEACIAVIEGRVEFDGKTEEILSLAATLRHAEQDLHQILELTDEMVAEPTLTIRGEVTELLYRTEQHLREAANHIDRRSRLYDNERQGKVDRATATLAFELTRTAMAKLVDALKLLGGEETRGEREDRVAKQAIERLEDAAQSG